MGPIQGKRRGRVCRGLAPIAAGLLALAVACGGGPNRPTPIPTAPAIACPSAITVSSVLGGGQVVTYPAPTTTGGTAPVSVECLPASGSAFNLGNTQVSCTARDAAAREATCSFSVTLTAATLSVKKFVAFGDSVTEGQNGRLAGGMRVVDVPNAYPTKLQSFFDFEFPDQGITVANEGKGGESLELAVKRLPAVLAAHHPDAVLLLDGYNDLDSCKTGQGSEPACVTATTVVINKLRECIQIAREPRFGVRYVFVSTLTPPGPATGPSDRRRDANVIAQTNGRIAQMVPGEGGILVDSYPQFLGHEVEYIDIDGLHLRPAGNEVLARAFLSAIKSAAPATFGGR